MQVGLDAAGVAQDTRDDLLQPYRDRCMSCLPVEHLLSYRDLAEPPVGVSQPGASITVEKGDAESNGASSGVSAMEVDQGVQLDAEGVPDPDTPTTASAPSPAAASDSAQVSVASPSMHVALAGWVVLLTLSALRPPWPHRTWRLPLVLRSPLPLPRLLRPRPC